MSKGNPRVTVRIPASLLTQMDAWILLLDESPRATKRWDRSEFLVQAVVDKINHLRRSSGMKTQVSQAANDEGFPREFFGD